MEDPGGFLPATRNAAEVLNFVLQLFSQSRALDVDAAVDVKTGAGGNESPDDHVLLQAAEFVHLPRDGRLRQHAGRELESGRGKERIRCQ